VKAPAVRATILRAPAVRATIERRLLVNYRVDPDALTAVLPAPFRPVLVDGQGIAGICLIRMGAVRLAGLPAAVGITTENAAHRVAVEWDTDAGPATGVYIPRRDTSSRLTVAVGGRVFPGWHHRARFRIEEGDGRFRVEMASDDGDTSVVVDARRAAALSAGSAFANLEAASRFFRTAPLGYSATRRTGSFDGVELDVDGWSFEPLRLDEVKSSFFDDPGRFPPGTAVLDSAFLMVDLATAWRAAPPLRLDAVRPALVSPRS
jgi:uncharacterized protein YqjF (DUF2071 family)